MASFPQDRQCHRDACRSETVSRARGRGTWLDEGEQARWRRYRHDGPRRRFALCRAALRAILRVRLGCRNEELAFGPASHGKPFSVVRGKPANINFNVSHSGEHGLIAVAAEGRLDVDNVPMFVHDHDRILEAIDRQSIRKETEDRRVPLGFGSDGAVISVPGQ